MSVDCTGYIGYTVTLKENLTHNDFDFFHNFNDEHGEYSQWEHKGKEKVRLVVDGMNGNYARLIFIEMKIDDCWISGQDYFALKSQTIPDDVYEQLNKAYKLMYQKDLDKNMVEYALWFQFS